MIKLRLFLVTLVLMMWAAVWAGRPVGIYSGLMYMASYKGMKTGWPQYTMFVLDIAEKPYKATLAGVEPSTEATMLRLLPTGLLSPDGKVWGWENTRGSTGITAIGGGLFYLSEDGYDQNQQNYYTNLRLYRWNREKGFVSAN